MSYRPRMRWWFVLLVGCGDFKTSSPSDASTTNDTSTTGDASSTSFGPGRYGALPSGYCCTKNEECRYRTCSNFGGVMMCSDPCDSIDGCNTAPNLTCGSASKMCEPTGAGKCIAQSQWPLGTKKLGDCCVATHDGRAGQECEGNRCVAFGPTTNPYICTQACSKPSDCPGNFFCSIDAFCVPSATDSYTCK